MGELRITVLESTATTENVLLKHNPGCQQFPGICCFNESDFPRAIDGQINDVNKEIDKISPVSFEGPHG